jgi:glycosyltransferase involved in cell wall biosynthesis
MEAIAAELPIISTAVGGIPEVLPGNMLTSAVDVAAIASKIQDVLANEGAARHAAHILSERVKLTTTAMDMAKKIGSLYERLLSG